MKVEECEEPQLHVVEAWRAGIKPRRPRSARAMSSLDHQISRSPTPPEPDDDGEEWPVHGIVGEDIDVFGISRYSTLFHTSPPFTPPNSNHSAQLRGKLSSSLISHSVRRVDNHLRYTRSDGKTGVVQTAPTPPGCARSRTTRSSSPAGTMR